MHNFHKLPFRDRQAMLKQSAQLSDEEMQALQGEGFDKIAPFLIENTVGIFSLPLAIATNCVIDGCSRNIPMVVEESSIVAALSATAKWVHRFGTITTSVHGELIVGQIHLPNGAGSKGVLESHADALVAYANEVYPSFARHNGGVVAFQVRQLGVHAVCHVLANSADAMGANGITQICELLAARIASMGIHTGISIVSNYTDQKIVRATCQVQMDDSAHAIIEAAEFAQMDVYRAVTHNKGISNGIDPLLIATGNDWRAAEAAMHAYAARSGSYQPLSQYSYQDGYLIGALEIPLSLGTVGGMTALHPAAKVALKILGVQHASELSRICAAVGLLQNLAALRALTSTGIIKGHMKLHATNIALAAGALPHQMEFLVTQLHEALLQKKPISVSLAQRLLR